MRVIQYVIGDATKPVTSKPAIIAHVCNDRGYWGKGFVLAVSKRWDEPELKYRAWAEEALPLPLGATQLIPVERDVWVANMIGQRGIRSVHGVPPVRYEAIATALEALAGHAKEREADIHMPRIGCGLAGGDWAKIEPIVISKLIEEGIGVFVYDLQR